MYHVYTFGNIKKDEARQIYKGVIAVAIYLDDVLVDTKVKKIDVSSTETINRINLRACKLASEILLVEGYEEVTLYTIPVVLNWIVDGRASDDINLRLVKSIAQDLDEAIEDYEIDLDFDTAVKNPAKKIVQNELKELGITVSNRKKYTPTKVRKQAEKVKEKEHEHKIDKKKTNNVLHFGRKTN